ncbi:MAG: choice-of-anchor D domain-containing protein [Tepidisphaeraceae bacterium]
MRSNRSSKLASAVSNELQSLEARQLMAAGPVLWSHDPSRRLYTVDVSTGATTIVGNTSRTLYDIAFDKTGQLFAIDDASNLYKVNKTSAALTLVGNFGKFANALVFSPTGTLYAAGSNSFFSINPTTAARTDIADLDGRSSAGDLAFAGDGRLYLSTTDGKLDRIDPATGAFTSIGATGFSSVFGLAYGPDGVMYGLSNSSREIFKLNLTTGAGTKISKLDSKVSGANGSSFFAEAARPEVEVRGKNVVIADNDATPVTTDDTDFGSVAVASGSVTHTFTIRNTGLGALTLGSVTVTGTNASDFVVTKQPGVASLRRARARRST